MPLRGEGSCVVGGASRDSAGSGATDELVKQLGDSEGQGGLACCSPWGHKESDVTEQLN